MSPVDEQREVLPDLGDESQEAVQAESRKILVWVPVFAAMFALLGLLAWGLVRDQNGPSSLSTNDGPAAVAVLSRPATDFTLPLYDPFNGQSDFRLSDYRGQVVVINFWASWCPPCREEAPVLEQMWRNYQGQDVVFVGVDIWDTEQDARAYMQEFGISFPNAVDNRGKIAVEYGVTGIPETYFITPDGMISRKVIGAITADILAQNIAEARTAGEGQ
jgi:cytochrome c biogenesis protein CcmG/thiol:disulfide interchange protein DsbE